MSNKKQFDLISEHLEEIKDLLESMKEFTQPLPDIEKDLFLEWIRKLYVIAKDLDTGYLPKMPASQEVNHENLDANKFADNQNPDKDESSNVAVTHQVESIEKADQKVVDETNIQQTMDAKQKLDEQSLAAKLSNRPLSSLKSSIGINQKFAFAHNLFGGNMKKRNEVIENIDSMVDYEDAKAMIDELATENNWPENHPNLGEFMRLVKRRFAWE